MNKLFIDCSDGMSVFVVLEKEVFSFVDHDQKKHTDNLLVKVDELLTSAKIKISDIDVFGVCVGPGSFTGIRVAVSVIKGLAVNSNAKIVEASNFDTFVCDEKNFCLVLDGFSNYVYVRTSDNGEVVDECVLINDFVNNIKNNKFEIYAENEKVQNLLKKYEIQSKIAEKDANLCFERKIQNKQFIAINEICPIYLRASQAEIERQKKLENENGSK